MLTIWLDIKKQTCVLKNKSMKLVISIFSLSILFSIATLHAQETMPITQAEALQKVLKDNNSLKISVEAFNEARADYRQTMPFFYPTLVCRIQDLPPLIR